MTAEATLPYSPPDTVLRVAGAPAARRRPALRLVAAVRTDAPRAPFVAVVVCLLVAGLLGLLVLNTVLAKDAFTLHTITLDSRTLADREQTLSREVEDLRSPQALADRAAQFGMVQAGPPAFLRLPDGAILGAATAGLPPGAVLGPGGQVVLPSPAPQPGATANANRTGSAATAASPGNLAGPGRTAGPGKAAGPGRTAGPGRAAGPGKAAGPGRTAGPGKAASPGKTASPGKAAGPDSTGAGTDAGTGGAR